jgi:glucan 1,3-beta-glucosidase
MLDFVTTSGYRQAFTIAPLNEASDNLTLFGSPGGLSEKAVRWVNQYHYGVLDRIAKVDPRIPMMMQDNFKGADFWADHYEEERTSLWTATSTILRLRARMRIMYR